MQNSKLRDRCGTAVTTASLLEYVEIKAYRRLTLTPIMHERHSCDNAPSHYCTSSVCSVDYLVYCTPFPAVWKLQLEKRVLPLQMSKFIQVILKGSHQPNCFVTGQW